MNSPPSFSCAFALSFAVYSSRSSRPKAVVPSVRHSVSHRVSYGSRTVFCSFATAAASRCSSGGSSYDDDDGGAEELFTSAEARDRPDPRQNIKKYREKSMTPSLREPKRRYYWDKRGQEELGPL